MNLPREIIVDMSNKYQMTKRIIDSNNEHVIPKTFLDLEECIDNYKTCNKNCRWYLKNIVGVDSNDVIRLANIDELINAWNLKLYPENYLAQQEIVSAKIKKEEHHDLDIKLEKNKDILSFVGNNYSKSYVVGFAAETDDVIKNAKEKDIILVAGKGHETYQEIKGTKHPFDDREVVARMLKMFMN